MGTTIDHQEAKGSPVSGAAQSGQISELLKPALLQIRQLTLKIPSTSQQNSAAVEWKLYYLNSYRSIFLSSESEDEIGQTVTQVITPYLNAGTRDFRLQLNIKSVPFLVGIFPADHKIFFCTPRLGSELFTLQEGGEFSHSPDYLELASLVERISALDMSAVPPSIEILTQKYQLADLLHDPAYQEIERENRLLTDKLLVEMNRYRPTLFERVTDWGLNLTAHYALIRVHLLKFLAILPSLDFDSGVEVKRILMESLHRLFTDSKLAAKLRRKGQGRSLPTSLIWMLRTLFYFSLIIPAIPLAFLVRTSVRWMARRFIAGETIERADRALTKLFLSGRDVTLDQLGELVVSEQEADHYCNEVIKLIKGFSLHVPRGQKNGAGINRANVSIKVSALSSDFKPQAFDYTYNSVAPRLSKILLAAKEEEVFLNIDAEHYDYRDVVLDIYSKVLLTTDQLKDFQQTGIVLQAYLRDAYGHYQKIVALAKQRGIMMPIRIVKGAYWDAETIEAEAHSFDAPEFLNKEETDLHFRQLTIAIFKDHPHVQLVIASHNFSDHTFVEVVRGRHYPSLPEIEHQCLHMTYEALSTGMQKMGWVVRNYLPVGSLLVGMAYLVRRIMENSSQVGVLMMMRSHKRGLASRSPQEMFLERVEQRKVEVDFSASKLTSHFFNLTPVRLYLEDDRFHFNYVLKQFQNHHLGKSYENSFKIDGDWHEVVSSSDPSILVGKIRFALTADALRAVELAESSYNSGKWAQLSPYARASFLVAAANIMSAKRNELASLICYEAGKAIPEALADIDEAVDFMNFYAREEVKIHKKMPNLISRGVILVVAPWNFPLAIPCGMTVSSLVAGNSIVLKSAKHTPLIAQSMIDILHQAGVPKDVLIHLPGKGSEIGDDLTADPRLAGVVFTGSKEVGMRIAHQVGKRVVHNKLYDRYYPTKVITEMGGKNGIIVTANAELDETVAGILYSAFGHSGQKCSACSRVMVDNRVKERLIYRLKEACLDLKVGKAFDHATYLNPLIAAGEKSRLIEKVKEARAEGINSGGRVYVDRSTEDLPGYCIGPTLIELPAHRGKEADSFATRELFGPVLHLIGFDTLDQALDIFNGTEYALTGGVFSQSQDDIDYLTSRMEVGNIYVNRTTTGARVAVEPFGGFKLSGTGPKAGGKAYLNSFHVGPQHEECGTILPTVEGDKRKIDLASPSLLSISARQERIVRAVERLIRNYEVLFPGVYSDNKEHLKKCKSWIIQNFESFITGEHLNRRIPGQLSYSNYSLHQEQALMVAYQERPSISQLLNMVAAVSVGVGLTIVARNASTYGWWSNVKDLFVASGFSTENLNVRFVDTAQLKLAIKEPLLSSVLVDGGHEQLQEVLEMIFDGKPNELRPKQVLSALDAPRVTDFKRYLGQFIWIRSFAVNTMRHGAPLDLRFD